MCLDVAADQSAVVRAGWARVPRLLGYFWGCQMGVPAWAGRGLGRAPSRFNPASECLLVAPTSNQTTCLSAVGTPHRPLDSSQPGVVCAYAPASIDRGGATWSGAPRRREHMRPCDCHTGLRIHAQAEGRATSASSLPGTLTN